MSWSVFLAIIIGGVCGACLTVFAKKKVIKNNK